MNRNSSRDIPCLATVYRLTIIFQQYPVDCHIPLDVNGNDMDAERCLLIMPVGRSLISVSSLLVLLGLSQASISWKPWLRMKVSPSSLTTRTMVSLCLQRTWVIATVKSNPTLSMEWVPNIRMVWPNGTSKQLPIGPVPVRFMQRFVGQQKLQSSSGQWLSTMRLGCLTDCLNGTLDYVQMISGPRSVLLMNISVGPICSAVPSMC